MRHSVSSVPAGIRVIATTSRNLRAAEHSAFREDLYYMLFLCDAFLRDIAGSFGRPPAGISREARNSLLTYEWPGNIRELRNVLERASILCEGGLITTEHITFASPDMDKGTSTDPNHLRSIEKATIERALADARHNKSLAAKRLGLSRKQLYVRLRQHGLE
jgi:DNA-binding NtrC family response regulator